MSTPPPTGTCPVLGNIGPTEPIFTIQYNYKLMIDTLYIAQNLGNGCAPPPYTEGGGRHIVGVGLFLL